jgi:hypothetical protein
MLHIAHCEVLPIAEYPHRDLTAATWCALNGAFAWFSDTTTALLIPACRYDGPFGN